MQLSLSSVGVDLSTESAQGKRQKSSQQQVVAWKILRRPARSHDRHTNDRKWEKFSAFDLHSDSRLFVIVSSQLSWPWSLSLMIMRSFSYWPT